jgi:predicted Zn-dependent protease
VLEAAGALARGHAARALDALQPAVPYERIGRFWPAYVRGLAYLHLRRPVDAVNQFRDILAHRGDDPASVLFPLAQLEIARALAAAGDAAGAREAYGRFIEWRGSPRGQPLTAVAIREQSKLPR